MKKILCFGDSNTFGFIPGSGGRYSKDERWTGRLKQELKDQFEVIEAGCNNRTCFIDNPDGLEQTGYKVLPKYLTKDIDIVIFAIGINDIQFLFNPDLNEIKNGVENLIDLARKINPALEIVLACPAELSEAVLSGPFSCQFDKNSIIKSKKYPEIYAEIAEEKNCKFVDLNKIAAVSNKDGLHFEAAGHKKISDYFVKFFRE